MVFHTIFNGNCLPDKSYLIRFNYHPLYQCVYGVHRHHFIVVKIKHAANCHWHSKYPISNTFKYWILLPFAKLKLHLKMY